MGRGAISTRETCDVLFHRLGFAATDNEVNNIAEEMYQSLQWRNHNYILQYISVGRRLHSGLDTQYPKLIQITWEDIGYFLYDRFVEFPMKLNVEKPIHRTWPDFGRLYGEYIRAHNGRPQKEGRRRYLDLHRDR